MDTTAPLAVGIFLTVAAFGGAALGGLMLALFAWLRSDIRDLLQRLDGFIDSHGPVRPGASEARALRDIVREVLREERAKPAHTTEPT